MLLTQCLILISAVTRVQLILLYQTQQFQFVDIGSTARLECVSSEKVEDRGLSFSWYKRRANGVPLLIKRCLDEEIVGKFACQAEGQKLALAIDKVQMEDSGLYFCAKRTLAVIFSNGSSLVVGDSYSPNSWVMILQPLPRALSLFRQSREVACVVHGISNTVQVSWDVPGHLQPETLLMENNSSSLTFISVLRIPADLRLSVKNLTCAVRFNSSGTIVKVNTEFPSEAPEKCLSYSVSLSVLGVLAVLMLLLSFLWIRHSRSRPGFQNQDSEPPPSLGSLCYTQLDFASRT
ncbi:uncharacterized protein LOC133374924 isoform X2 [Rhineura floridana]|uniref:uncharacterized protein LOC133374924 isoform X2 n=1 Tax=Rhineura floridana TaxID=261503 RepID=UPI002AC82590|nr:uncharacterized protein LOC133374924 isoform X2 [Rhineura floridana]